MLAATFTAVMLHTTGLQGDEYTYVGDSRTLGNALAGRPTLGGGLADALFGTGWFMPGMKLWGALLFAVVPEPSQALVRGWAALLNAALLAVLVRLTWTAMGHRAAILMLVFPAFALLWDVAAFSFLPDVPGALLAATGMVMAYRIALRLAQGDALEKPWRAIAALQLVLAAGIYMRGPVLLLALAVNGALVLWAVACRRAKECVRLVAGCLLLPLALLPWSVAVSYHFDTPVLTTTNFPLVLADSFGNPARTCFGPCTLPGPDIWPSWQFAQKLGHEAGENPLHVERRMMAASLEGLSLQEYLRKVRDHMDTFLMAPQGWLKELQKRQYGALKPLRPLILTVFTAQTLILYIPLMLALLAANLVVVHRGLRLQLQSVAIKLATLSVLMQPFFHKSSGRYWGGLAPFAAWSLALLIAMVRRGRGGGEGPSGAEGTARWLTVMQAAFVTVFAGLGAAVLAA